MTAVGPLAIIDTHPVQYRAPVYQALARDEGIDIRVIYASDFSIAGARDREFGVRVAWDTDLLSGTNPVFLSRAAEGGADCFEKVSARGLGEAIERVRPSAVLATGYRPWFYAAGMFRAWRRRIPLLFRAETSDTTTGPGGRERGAAGYVRDAALRRLYGACERVLPIGERSRAHYRRLGVPDDKMIFSPYCVNTAPFRAEERDRESMREPMRRELGIDDGALVILFAGKLSERKGVHTLVAAVKHLPPEIRSRAVVAFLGAGAEQESLARACAEAPVVRTLFIGFRNQRELSPYYHAADVFTLPSLWGETWGLVVNEALHHGVPCAVSSAVGCGPDLIHENLTGAVAEAGSAEGLAAAILRAAGLADCVETRARCRERAGRYSTAAAARGIARAWREVAGRRAGTSPVTAGTAA